MKNAMFVAGLVVVSLTLGAPTASFAQIGKAAMVSPGKTSAFVNVRDVACSVSEPIASVTILRAKSHSVLQMQGTLATSGFGNNPSAFSLSGAIYVEDEASGQFVVPPQTLGGQVCPAGLGGNCTLSFTAFLDLDDPAYAIFVNKRVSIELFALAQGELVDGTLAVQLQKK
jgi:hypothetical protein